MVKNEIHARVTPETMEQIRQFTETHELPNISATVRWLIDIAFKVVNDEFEAQQKNNAVMRLIEQEYKVFFARCRDEYDPEDGELYWFWFDSELDSSWRFDADSPNNWCPTKRFVSRDEAIRDCLREKLLNQVDVNEVTESNFPSNNLSTKFEAEQIIDW